jgi:hypothetical protein
MENIIKKVFPIFMMAILLVSCFELEQIDPNRQNDVSFWVNQDQLDMGVISCYDRLQGYYNGRAHWMYCGLSDN